MLYQGDEVNDIFQQVICDLHHGYQSPYVKKRDIDTGLLRYASDAETFDRLVAQSSRYGDVIKFRLPVTIQYGNPWQHVLFNKARNCNPFFHLYEALWMLAGRNDVESVARFAKRMAEFSDDGQTYHGAYGHRWRHHFGGDQIATIIQALKANPDDRRQVLQMWDPQADLQGFKHRVHYKEYHQAPGEPQYDYPPVSKDIPCNTQVIVQTTDGVLDISVTNRSNDIFWGLFGSNYVTFSLLHEYLADMTGLRQGLYTHFTANAHYYVDRYSDDDIEKMHDREESGIEEWPSEISRENHCPLVSSPESFDLELANFVDDPFDTQYRNQDSNQRFIREIAHPMMMAWQFHKRRMYVQAFKTLDDVTAEEWRYSAHHFLSGICDKYHDRQATPAPTRDA